MVNETIQISSVNKIAWLKSHNINEIDTICYEDANRQYIDYIFNNTDEVRELLNKFKNDSEMYEFLKCFKRVKDEMREIRHSRLSR
ncbi:DUF5659 domain-containing protein [Clostridium grantii]|uniref:DUF5659 domain-containing protein n=1 Tax=Clostridium grantii DSM 8605 TaxID=1121316 RepID=A0A1M5SEZ8_9CLOT|nr:DUF5659 domain-containing protein [Clostridium grantii]SHH36483.1 hypothetical protein SAMN02745207_00877 [Clostridium grantii DSM 8605]